MLDFFIELHGEGIKVGKFDVEEANVQFLEIWDIRGFPTISVFVNGEFYKYDQAGTAHTYSTHAHY